MKKTLLLLLIFLTFSNISFAKIYQNNTTGQQIDVPTNWEVSTKAPYAIDADKASFRLEYKATDNTIASISLFTQEEFDVYEQAAYRIITNMDYLDQKIFEQKYPDMLFQQPHFFNKSAYFTIRGERIIDGETIFSNLIVFQTNTLEERKRYIFELHTNNLTPEITNDFTYIVENFKPIEKKK